ncbi:conserved protein of unknown function (Cytochrome c domain 279-445) [Magnetospirillum sp. XM-1]|uniref:di-heme oxidoreductase family protein n=1 Tax=Magnetospirillum sp. XM-1 TaxID=1663591 RepID=UPI00073DFE1C|nr:di-heme oxidoredictase family protein [Magnetospirillum sp. XM-1]CUW41601.1 conserved protein of unknown function (Cytochrome c domain 279-445) [Magnetospirillum sp. XM-1]
MRRLLLAAGLSLAAPATADEALSGGAFTVFESGRAAFSTMAPALPEALHRDFAHGRTVFNRPWLAAPSLDERFTGLGPLFNRLSCVACHPRNSGGFAPEGPDEPMRTMLVRLSVPGADPHGGPKPHPAYGDQLNEEGVPGVPGEGRAMIRWRERRETLPGGEVVRLRRPELRFVRLAYGPLGADALTSPRIAPPVHGLGLLAAIPETDILAIAAENGGRPNRVWDAGHGKTVLGRFGWKANQPSVHQQLAGAMLGDIGITSPLFSGQNCAPAQEACRRAAAPPQPELTAGQLLALETYHLGLGVPARRGIDDPSVRRGEAIFAAAGCAACHRPVLTTGPHPWLAELGGQTIHPYTDLLLHDMGEGLADGRPDFLASGREWRTPPLWGLGLRPVVAERVGLLHDGRARNALEAILWHGGQAKAAADAVRRLTPDDRRALLRFLDSL